MTNRDLGEVGIKLIGVYFAAASLVGLMRAAVSFSMPTIEGISSSTLGQLNLVAVIGGAAVAAACLAGGGRLATLIFGGGSSLGAHLPRRDLLVVGLALIGVSSTLSSIGAIVQAIGNALWYAESSRQSQLLPMMDRSWQSIATSLPQLIVGALLVVMAGRLASALDARYAGAGRIEG